MNRLAIAIAVVLAGCGGATKPANGGASSGPASTGSDGSSGGGSKGGAGGDNGGGGAGGTSGGASNASGGGGSVSSGDSGPAPESIAADLPPSIEKTPAFGNHAECPKTGGCNLKNLVPDSLKAQIDDKSPVFIWEQVMDRKVALLLPKHSGVDVYVIVLDGEVSVMAEDIEKKQKRLWKWNAAHIPGAGVQIYSKEPTRMLLAVVVNGQSGTVRAALDALPKSTWSKRPSPVTSIELPAQPDLAWGGGAYHVRLGFPMSASDANSASLETLMTSKNAPVSEHTHDKEWEILAVVQGDGDLVRKPGGASGKEEKTKIGPGAIAMIPPGVAHAFRPAGSTPMVALQMYWPPGPEQRFKKLAADSPLSPKP